MAKVDKSKFEVQDRLRNPTKGMTDHEKYRYYLETIREFHHDEAANFLEKYIDELIEDTWI